MIVFWSSLSLLPATHFVATKRFRGGSTSYPRDSDVSVTVKVAARRGIAGCNSPAHRDTDDLIRDETAANRRA